VTTEEAIETLQRATVAGRPFEVALIPQGSSADSELSHAIRADQTLRQTSLIAVMNDDEIARDLAAVHSANFVTTLYRPLTQSRLLDAIATATVRRSPVIKPASIVADPARQLLHGLHLLVAEDNEMNQFVAEQTLIRAGCTCEVVSDGFLAIQALESREYDAVLMDCHMPGMDGLETTRQIRQREAREARSRRVPIIALTADASQGDRQKCLEAGMDEYVTKPINPKDLFDALASLVRAQPQIPEVDNMEILDAGAETRPGRTMAFPNYASRRTRS
jgi:CheY-like chemotaxis protein